MEGRVKFMLRDITCGEYTVLYSVYVCTYICTYVYSTRGALNSKTAVKALPSQQLGNSSRGKKYPGVDPTNRSSKISRPPHSGYLIMPPSLQGLGLLDHQLV
jgi:hypothetical protein